VYSCHTKRVMLYTVAQAWSILERELDAAVLGVDGGARQWLLNSLEESAVVVSDDAHTVHKAFSASYCA
jgi:uncharacterized RmlC-like cupin family protein